MRFMKQKHNIIFKNTSIMIICMEFSTDVKIARNKKN